MKAGRKPSPETAALMAMRIGDTMEAPGTRCRPCDCPVYGKAIQLHRRNGMKFSGRQHPTEHGVIIIRRTA